MLNNVIDILGKLVFFDTSNPLKGNKEILKFIIKYLEKFPLQIDLIESNYSDNKTLYAYTQYNNKPEILFSGHLDVVSIENQDWKFNPFKINIIDNKIYGRGTCDMKGFIACVLSLIPEFVKNKLPFALALTYDEETRCKSVVELLESFNNYKKPKMALLGEPTNMEILTMHKGVYELKISIKGQSAHASNPLNGINSIKIASKIINYIEELEEELKTKDINRTFIPSYTTVNVGIIKGGTAGNIVPESCFFKVDIRPVLQTHIEWILNKLSIFNNRLQEETKASIYIENTCNLPSFNNNNIKNGKVFMATTEAGFYGNSGMNVIICGCGSLNQAHKPDEFVSIEQLNKCCNFLKNLNWR
jgi:acetylornithine deacetylase